jgi:hypothetical protein
MKKILLVILSLYSLSVYGQQPPIDKARGVFLAFGVGPRLPVGDFSNSTDVGSGFDVDVSYTDNQYIPFFIFARAGFDQFPGSQQYYETTDYSNYSTNVIPVNLGIRYYFPPLVQNIVLFMPVVEVSFDYSYYHVLNQFKLSSGKSNYFQNSSKLGVTAGAGLSMFMMEVLVSYNYFRSNQYVGLDLRIRLPLYINL